MRPLQICIGPTIRIGRKSWFLPYAGFFCMILTTMLSIYQYALFFQPNLS